MLYEFLMFTLERLIVCELFMNACVFQGFLEVSAASPTKILLILRSFLILSHQRPVLPAGIFNLHVLTKIVRALISTLMHSL